MTTATTRRVVLAVAATLTAGAFGCACGGGDAAAGGAGSAIGVPDPCELLTATEAEERIGGPVDRIGPDDVEGQGLTCTFVPDGTDLKAEPDAPTSVISVATWEGTDLYPDDELADIDAETQPVANLGDEAILIEAIATIAWTDGDRTFSVTYTDATAADTDVATLDGLAHMIEERT